MIDGGLSSNDVDKLTGTFFLQELCQTCLGWCNDILNQSNIKVISPDVFNVIFD